MQDKRLKMSIMFILKQFVYFMASPSKFLTNLVEYFFLRYIFCKLYGGSRLDDKFLKLSFKHFIFDFSISCILLTLLGFKTRASQLSHHSYILNSTMCMFIMLKIMMVMMRLGKSKQFNAKINITHICFKSFQT